MGDSPEKKMILCDSVLISIRFFHYYFAWHNTIVQVSKFLKVQTYYKTLINHRSRCSNSRQQEM